MGDILRYYSNYSTALILCPIIPEPWIPQNSMHPKYLRGLQNSLLRATLDIQILTSSQVMQILLTCPYIWKRYEAKMWLGSNLKLFDFQNSNSMLYFYTHAQNYIETSTMTIIINSGIRIFFQSRNQLKSTLY